jgi:hypothetical protein
MKPEYQDKLNDDQPGADSHLAEKPTRLVRVSPGADSLLGQRRASNAALDLAAHVLSRGVNAPERLNVAFFEVKGDRFVAISTHPTCNDTEIMVSLWDEVGKWGDEVCYAASLAQVILAELSSEQRAAATGLTQPRALLDLMSEDCFVSIDPPYEYVSLPSSVVVRETANAENDPGG